MKERFSYGQKKLCRTFLSCVLIPCWLQNALFAKNQIDKRLEPYVQTLREKGQAPVKFVLKKLEEHDLLLFDDAAHPAVEPFEYCQTLVKNRSFQERVKYIFVEAFVLNRQPAIDAYLAAPKENKNSYIPSSRTTIPDLAGLSKPIST